MKHLDLAKQQKKSSALGRAGKSKKFYLSKEMGAELDVRILPPRDNVGDVFWLEVPVWWVKTDGALNPTPYVSPEIFTGGRDVIQEEIDNIKEEYAGNRKVLSSIDKLLNSKNCKKNYEELTIGLVFDFKRGKDHEIKGIWAGDLTREEAYEVRKILKKNPKKTMAAVLEEEYGIKVSSEDNIGKLEPVDFDKLMDYIVDGEIKVISMGQKPVKAIVATLTKKALLKEVGDAPLSGLDQLVGFNTTIYKSGKDRDTSYTAEHDTYPMEMPEWMFEEDNKPDLVGLVKSQIKSDEYLVAVVRNYLLGEDMPDEEDEIEDTPKNRRARNSDDTGRSNKRSRDDDDDDEDDEEEDEEEPKKRSKTQPVTKSNKRSRDEDEEEEQEEDEEEPKKRSKTQPVTKSNKRSRDEDEEEEQEEDEEEPKKRSKTQPVTKSNKQLAAKKTGTKSLADAIDEMDELNGL
jgi:hypothetical protein